MPDFLTTLTVPGTSPLRVVAVKVRNTSHLPTLKLTDLFEQTLRMTWSRGDCKPEQFGWMGQDFRLHFKTMRPSRSHFSGYARHNKPVTIMGRFAKDCPIPYIALVMEHEIRHLMGENHRAMNGKPWRAYHTTRSMIHHYDWAESFWTSEYRLAAARSY